MYLFFEVSRSGYYAFVKRLEKPESDAKLAKKIKECQIKTDKIYGYRQVWKWGDLGLQVHKCENLPKRSFHADRPNSKMITDIPYNPTQKKECCIYL